LKQLGKGHRKGVLDLVAAGAFWVMVAVVVEEVALDVVVMTAGFNAGVDVLLERGVEGGGKDWRA
jgi:hypothetical protein